jgi:hypothetical protein
VSLTLDPPHALRSEWCDEDSILGDYMRVVSDYQEHDERPIELRSLIGEDQLPGRLQSDSWLTDPFERDEVLRQAAMLGLDMLRGDDRLPHEAALSSS